ncbi:uncharacterized protein F5891DRAFT_1196138 [Suillus fuscotomentosus]|uniref:Uncharacterized protein n=1 Tax=Suillus fuscotomentosus TaxID=1912939 RepID=A0AAD4HDH9_9AGAM|nr:uncharacterized protein F5891DRAFT_1196138 [Suillus fuscotomentosus]KAG1893610.1 hypothetical protein F5891DRAFT_1196138 [Suillus fuscotomentosus]
MSSDYNAHNNSHPSDFNDEAELILTDANFRLEDCLGRSTPESHIGCHGCGHGKSVPAYSCRCYQQNFGQFKSKPSSPDDEEAFQPTDYAPCSKRKWSEDDGGVTNIGATSVPIVELLPEKHMKVERKFESFEGELLAKMAAIMQEVVGHCQTQDIGTSAPKHKSADWMNKFLDRLWLIYKPVLSAIIVTFVDKMLSTTIPAFSDSLHLTTFTLGMKTSRIDKVRTSPRTANDVAMMQRNPKIVQSVRLGKGLATAFMLIPGLQTFIQDIIHYMLSPVEYKQSKLGAANFTNQVCWKQRLTSVSNSPPIPLIIKFHPIQVCRSLIQWKICQFFD